MTATQKICNWIIYAANFNWNIIKYASTIFNQTINNRLMKDILSWQETQLRLQKINRSHCSMQGETVQPDSASLDLIGLHIFVKKPWDKSLFNLVRGRQIPKVPLSFPANSWESKAKGEWTNTQKTCRSEQKSTIQRVSNLIRNYKSSDRIKIIWPIREKDIRNIVERAKHTSGTHKLIFWCVVKCECTRFSSSLSSFIAERNGER